MGYTRRDMLTAMGGVGAAGATGCLSSGTADDDGVFTAGVSFPVVHDFAESVVPEEAEANNLVPVGQHGHGWNPSPDVQRSVTGSDAFVYVFEGFQPWADNMVTNLERDHPDVEVIAAGKGIDMLGVDSAGVGHEDEHDHGGEHEGEEQDSHDEENGDAQIRAGDGAFIADVANHN